MSQQVKIYRDLEFLGNANHTGNIKGLPSTEKVVFVDHFTGVALDTTNDWNSAGQASGAAAIAAPHMVTITTEANDNDEWALASPLNWYGQYNAVLEVRMRNNDVDGIAHNIGFSDATAESGTIAMTYSGTTLTSTAEDFAGFLLDVDATTKNIYGVSSKATADGSVINSAHTEGDASWATYRVELRDNGTTTDALFYLNTAGKEIDPGEDLIGIEIDAITRTDPLCIYIAGMNRESAANTLDIDYVKAWQDVQ